jgi:hypothetical protein
MFLSGNDAESADVSFAPCHIFASAIEGFEFFFVPRAESETRLAAGPDTQG